MQLLISLRPGCLLLGVADAQSRTLIFVNRESALHLLLPQGRQLKILVLRARESSVDVRVQKHLVLLIVFLAFLLTLEFELAF